MTALAMIGLILKILLYGILGLVGFILLLLAFPFHLSVTGFYDGKDLSYEVRVRYAWLIPLDRLLKSGLNRPTKAIPIDDPLKIKKEIHNNQQEPSVRKPSTPKSISTKPQEPKPEEPPIQAQKSMDFQEILHWIQWGLEQKDTFWRAALRLFRLFHIRPLLLRGQMGLDDPADTAFLFSTIYTALPQIPYVAFQVQPNYREQTLSVMIRFKCHISILEILLTLILNRDLRRTLLMIYRMSRPKSTAMKPAEI